MNWKKLETFKEISKYKSFNRASKVLNKSQSSFSRDIMSLEKDLGFKLFSRHMKNGIQLVLFSSYQMINFNKLLVSLLACFPILIGVYFGAVLRKRISESFFKTLFNMMLVIMGGLLIIKIIF